MTERRKRFALILKDGTAVENLESLRENFELQRIRQYFESGELLEWLKSWRYSDLVPKIETLVEFDPKLNKKLCNIFGVNYKKHAPIEEIEIRKEKLAMLREITTDQSILSRIDQIAFNTREVHDLLEDEVKKIFLFEGEYNFACGIFDEINVHYYGIGRVSIKIETNLKIDFAERGIEFENITVDGKFFPDMRQTRLVQKQLVQKLLTCLNHKLSFKKAKHAYDRKNYIQAFALFMQAAELGNADAMFFLALCYENGNGTKTNLEKAVEWYKKSAELGNAKSMNNLGLCYQEGKGVNQAHLQAVIYFQKASELGNAYAMNNLGECYYNGLGVNCNYEKAVQLFKKAVELGNSDAMNNLGIAYRDGRGISPNMNKAFELFKKSAELGNSNAMNNLGVRYYKGEGTAKNYKLAFEWFRKSAELGNDKATNNIVICYSQVKKLLDKKTIIDIGNCYFYGRGVKQNFEKAVELYQSAVNNLDAEAMNNLGECYYNGLGTKQTFKKAVQLFKKAVELGNSDAMNNLGIACRDGRGISPDKKKAAELFKKSAQLGNAKAKKNLSQL